MPKSDKLNILVIWGDDIGVHNISAYNHGIMGYRTPNIDRLAREGALFTDAYGEQSCTAGRAAFILGQHPFRTGLLTIGMPGSPHGIPDWAPTIADLLKPLGYSTAQFGKNHLGDRDSHLPTAHGFDEFFGNLYHLNAEEEPENRDYPKNPEFRKKFGPRGVIKATADELWGDDEFDAGFTEEPELLGVERSSSEGVTIRLVVKTRPASQYRSQRELRRRIRIALSDAGVPLPQAPWIRPRGEPPVL